MKKIKHFSSRVWDFIKNHYIVSAIILLVVLGVVFALSQSGAETEEVRVERGIVTETVQASGTTKPIQDASFGFEKSGKVARVPVRVGDRVEAGAVLVELEQGEASANLLKARAMYAADAARLADIRGGTRSEDIAISEAQVAEAQVSLEDATNNLVVSMQKAFDASDNAVRNYADQFFTNLESTSPSWKSNYTATDGTILTLDISNSALRSQVIDSRALIQRTLPSWITLVSSLSPNDPTLLQKVKTEKEYVNIVSAFLNNLAAAVNLFTSPSSTHDGLFAGFRNDIATARTNVATALSNLIAAEEKYNNARLGLTVEQGQLTLKRAGSTNQALAAQEATTLQSRAAVLAAEAEFAKTLIKAPFAGTVTNIDVEPGEIVSPGTNILRLIGNGDFNIETNVSEVNIAKVAIGNTVEVTFDALPGQVFSGTVSYIDPAETIVDAVVNYKVTVTLPANNPGVKSGMTANLNIKTNQKDNVVSVPLYALQRETGGVFSAMKQVSGSKTEKINVTLGLIGSDGRAEVVSGLEDGDILIVQK